MNINLEIAKRKGYEIQTFNGELHIVKNSPGRSEPGNNVCRTYLAPIPDYQNDPALILELQMELLAKRITPLDVSTPNLKLYTYAEGNVLYLNEPVESFGTATCLAWLEEFKDV